MASRIPMSADELKSNRQTMREHLYNTISGLNLAFIALRRIYWPNGPDGRFEPPETPEVPDEGVAPEYHRRIWNKIQRPQVSPTTS